MKKITLFISLSPKTISLNFLFYREGFHATKDKQVTKKLAVQQSQQIKTSALVPTPSATPVPYGTTLPPHCIFIVNRMFQLHLVKVTTFALGILY